MSLLNFILTPVTREQEDKMLYREFCKQFPEYRSTLHLDALRQKEYPLLQKNQHTYLDFTGANLFPRNLLQQHLQLLNSGIFGNPHSTNPASLHATQLVDDARKYVLQYFHAEDDYYCIFTANASGALKIVGECYPFNEESFLLLSLDNHNSVNGIREFAAQKKCAFQYTPLHSETLYLDKEALQNNLAAHPGKKNKLFAFPAQSNVSGIKHPLSYITMAQEKGWHVLLDAAAFVPTDVLDLRDVKPEFVTMSFYKIFGYPTGVGCLLMRKDILTHLQKPWYAGGTITLSAANYRGHFLKDNEERFEDGTVNYLNIPAIKMGLQFIEKIGVEMIKTRVTCLAQWLISKLSQLRHPNGNTLLKIFGAEAITHRGGTLVMNFYNSSGTVIPFWKIEQAANEQNISIRTGCFCNPGLDETNNRVYPGDLEYYFNSREKGDYFEMIEVTKKIRGSVRISLGMVSNFADVYRFYAFAKSFVIS
ncbi:MAG: aminotransferase class V-fold PLP-dependent enzyme [Bacteroidetes bacterium]|nr:aminotransferase class V-fold PLP-dependent enzyme [Bacteroidota bacterium]